MHYVLKQRWIFMCYVRLPEGFPTASSIGYYVEVIFAQYELVMFSKIVFFSFVISFLLLTNA